MTRGCQERIVKCIILEAINRIECWSASDKESGKRGALYGERCHGGRWVILGRTEEEKMKSQRSCQVVRKEMRSTRWSYVDVI